MAEVGLPHAPSQPNRGRMERQGANSCVAASRFFPRQTPTGRCRMNAPTGLASRLELNVGLFVSFRRLLLVAVAAGWAPAFAADGPDVAFFEKNIRPVLVEHCYKCHSNEG